MHFKELANHYLPYAQKRMGFDKLPTINFIEDEDNAADPLGKTGHYNPATMEVVVYISGRHPKDVLRSLSHELVHHAQNCRGDLSSQKVGEVGDNYAQSNMHLRNMELQAYKLGNIVFRDWCDSHKGKLMMEKVEKKEQPLNEWLNDERFNLLMGKFGILSEAKKMPMKTDTEDADNDGNTTEKVPAFLDKGDTKKKKTSGKVPPQLQKYIKGKQEKSEKKDLEEKKMTKAEKKEEEKIGKKLGKAKVKSKMQKHYGKEKGEEVFYGMKRKQAMENA